MLLLNDVLPVKIILLKPSIDYNHKKSSKKIFNPVCMGLLSIIKYKTVINLYSNLTASLA